MRSERQSSALSKQTLRVVGPFIPIVFALMLASSLSIDLLSSVRAYVGGESLWSKGQKDAVLHLIRYGETHNEDEFLAYQRAIAVPLGDRVARIELLRAQPDLDKAAAGLIAGGNHPDDIPGMIRLVLDFRRLPPLEHAITVWTQADAEVKLLSDLAEQLHAATRGGDHGAANIAHLMLQIRESNARLTRLEEAFSYSLGEVSRLVRDLLIPGIDVASILLLAAGIFLAVRGMRLELNLRQALSHSEERLTLAISGSNDGLWDWDVRSNAFYFSARCAQMLGYHECELPQSFATLLALIHPDDFASIELKLRGHLQDSLPFDAKFRLRTRTNTYLWVRSRGRMVRDTVGLAQRMAGSLTDITEQKRAEALLCAEQAREREHAARLAHDATHDALTGLINRIEFERRLADAMQRGQSENCTHVLMYLDLDQFKVVNDTCGHAAGDELIQQLVSVMTAELRKSDMLARLGGDEFGVLLEDCTTEDGECVADSLREAIARFRFVHRTRSFALGASIGMIRLDADVSHVAEALSAADAACYLAKQRGRNRVQVYQPHDDAVRVLHDEMEWVSRTHAAPADGRFALHAQQVVPLQADSGTGRHIELLLRMVDEQGQLVPPMAFIPACERYNLMPTLDRWVIDAGFAELGRLRRANQADIAVCGLNLSAASLSDDQLSEHIRERAAHHGIPLDIVCFEITETAAISNLTQATSFIRQLQAMGCRFALDDFGAGMSSFAYLKHLPAEYIKIDGGFVREMFDDPINMVVIEAIQRIAQAMGMKTVAEWVDSDEALTHLRELGVDYAQGYGVARPVHFAGRREAGLQNVGSAA
ncbi:EAL domain-containing protein [Paraburkholderia sediminicola]|uniref:EAL domain-containing protein n=1 Tax=Paraburkholderia sediminicola TaxID=458836 RepID=UPI0038BDA931